MRGKFQSSSSAAAVGALLIAAGACLVASADPVARYALDDRIAIQGMAGILDLPKEVVRSMPPLNISGTSAGNGEDHTFGDAA